MTLVTCFILPLVVFVILMLAMKWANVSFIPKDWQLPPPKPFKMPHIRRGVSRWYVEDEDDE